MESLDKECQNKNTVFFHHLNVLFPFMDHLKSTIKKVEEFSDKVLGWQEADIKSYYDLLLGWIL